MRDLVLRFGGGNVEGEGVDLVGRFSFRGTYDSAGNVMLVKQYLGRHQVLYRGSYDGEGTIFGEWSIFPIWRGPFALRLEDRPASAEMEVITIEAPASVD
jgi:hypothetical protein